MAAKKKASTARAAPNKAAMIIKIISLILILAILGGAIYFALATNGFSQFEYVSYNGQKLSMVERNFRLHNGSNEFQIKSMNPFSDKVSYSVRIQANSEAKFNFTADCNPQSFSRLGDMTDCFSLELSETGFKLDIPSGTMLQDILKQKYPDAKIEIEGEIGDAEMFLMLITLSNGSAIKIYFDLPSFRIEIDPPQIIF